MRILINNKQAVLKKGTTIDYIMENRYFTDSDDFTLNISFPLAGCPRNIAIFGHLNRKDVDNPNSAMPCTILDRHLSVKGVVAITEINETEVKVQFLAGRSVSNYSTNLDKIYINELTFSDDLPSSNLFNELNETVKSVWGFEPTAHNYGKYVAIPWINNTTGVLHNQVFKGEQEGSYLMYDREPIDYMPYMLHLAKEICKAVGLSYDFSAWENSDLKYLLCCNVMPYYLYSYNLALPHWSVKHFFKQLEYLLHCEFNIDTLNSSITYVSPEQSATLAGDYRIENPIDDFSANVENILREDETEKPQLFKYSDSCPAIHTCDWLIRKYRNNVIEIRNEEQWYTITNQEVGFAKYKSDIASDLIQFNPSDKIFHYRNTYYIQQIGRLDHTEVIDGISYDFYEKKLVTIAEFAPFLDKEDEDKAKVIEFVPVSFVETAFWLGPEICLDLGEYVAEEDMSDPNYDAKKNLGRYDVAIQEGEQKELPEYYNTIYVGMAYPVQTMYGNFICQYRPFISPVNLNQLSWTFYPLIERDYEYTDIFRLKQNRHYSGTTTFRDIDVKTEYHFKWVADELPNIRSMFYINGKKYVAKKITATFDDNGMSQLIKGVFYRVLK